jgi:hypothetical protein
MRNGGYQNGLPLFCPAWDFGFGASLVLGISDLELPFLELRIWDLFGFGASVASFRQNERSFFGTGWHFFSKSPCHFPALGRDPNPSYQEPGGAQAARSQTVGPPSFVPSRSARFRAPFGPRIAGIRSSL